MIQDLLQFKFKLDSIVENSFKGDPLFNNIIRNSFIKFINSKQNKPAQLLAKYIDLKLRTKDISEEELEVLLDRVMVIFRYIQGKDIFEAFYKKDLAKRLLLGKSTSQDAEDSMIGKLKSECGTAFTSKIEGMFKDINISEGMNSAFKQHLNHTTTFSSDLCINVLTSSFWPNYPSYNVNIPAELVNYQVTFQKFYSINHSGRKLVWQPNLGHCLVKAGFESGNKELQVSLFQAMVLLLFNNSEKLTFSEIVDLTNMDMEELKRTLISLASSKSKVLMKQSKGKDIENDDTFCVNNKFSDKLFRVKINQIQLKESMEEQKATEKSVLADRQFQIDAAIVRILKNKKRISHNELISELFNVLDIPVKPYDLKKRIELLIEREYMERDKDDSSNYIYIA
ncbi:cullin-4A [Leptinotarsa decemlineata]|uniref:cullin-4A n=1 Tax=Leptinotarsa decemlineata TaxID=7539 RepID=UPI003D30B022